MELITVRELFKNTEKYVDQEIEIGGWVRNKRPSKQFGFIVLNDGTYFSPVQVVYTDALENFQDITKINMQVDAYLEENLKHLEYFINDKGLSRDTHPVNPIRVQSLNLYATCPDEKALAEKMDEIIGALMKLSNDEVDYYLGFFVATAGLIAINIDGEVTSEEIERVLNNLSSFHIFPRQFLEDVSQQDVVKIFHSSIEEILKRRPDMRDAMLSYVITLILADSSFNQQEVDFIFEIGEKCFGFSTKEIADRMAGAIQQNFIPSYEAIC